MGFLDSLTGYHPLWPVILVAICCNEHFQVSFGSLRLCAVPWIELYHLVIRRDCAGSHQAFVHCWSYTSNRKNAPIGGHSVWQPFWTRQHSAPVTLKLGLLTFLSLVVIIPTTEGWVLLSFAGLFHCNSILIHCLGPPRVISGLLLAPHEIYLFRMFELGSRPYIKCKQTKSQQMQ